ncbi:MAG: SEC-C domain-containing protein [Anaerolineales bacterium]|nr:SEC-C domain-containing protein [Anaerolineales bacterium]
MNYADLTAEQLIHKLNVAGRYPHPDLINAIWERRAATEPLLLTLFAESFDDNWPKHDDPRWYRFIHAGKFMLSWQNLDSLPTFARLYGSDDDDIKNWCEWFEEDLFHFGPPIIPYLEPIVRQESGNEWHYGKGLSGSILTRIATYYPETRDDITAVFRAQLPPPDAIPPDKDEMWGVWASELGELADETSRDHILALADAGIFSRQFFGEQEYRRDMNRGFRPQNPPPPYDVRNDYQKRDEAEQAEQKRLAREREQQRASRIRAAQPRTEPKVGRNDPCPCGSGKKYKKCHGRPGV